MSLAGSLVFIVYLILRPITVKYFSSTWCYHLLKLALLFYLLPYQYFKYIYYDAFYIIFFHRQYMSPEFLSGFCSYDLDKLILIDSEGKYSVKNGNILFVTLAIWSVIVISFAVFQVIKYISCKKALLRISTTTDPASYLILDQCREHTHIQKKVELFSCPYINTPFTIGIFSPCIFFPDILKREKTFKMIISHELIHVKNRDIFIKLIALIVIVLHCYNPLTYFLYLEICRVHEYVCDEIVTKNMTPEEKEKYKLLIVEMAQKPLKSNTIFSNALSGNFKMIKKRIILMDKSVISPRCMHIVSFALALLLLVMSPLSVLAYSPMVTNKSEQPDSNLTLQGDIYYDLSPKNLYPLYIEDPFLEFGTDYDIFVSHDGVSSVIKETTSQEEQSICVHSWQVGYMNQHFKNSDGSCTVNIYETQFCSKCDISNNGKLFSSAQYPKCPH